jgi:hypothetical protein
MLLQLPLMVMVVAMAEMVKTGWDAGDEAAP